MDMSDKIRNIIRSIINEVYSSNTRYGRDKDGAVRNKDLRKGLVAAGDNKELQCRFAKVLIKYNFS
jgi:hypothetical protein